MRARSSAHPPVVCLIQPSLLQFDAGCELWCRSVGGNGGDGGNGFTRRNGGNGADTRVQAAARASRATWIERPTTVAASPCSVVSVAPFLRVNPFPPSPSVIPGALEARCGQAGAPRRATTPGTGSRPACAVDRHRPPRTGDSSRQRRDGRAADPENAREPRAWPPRCHHECAPKPRRTDQATTATRFPGDTPCPGTPPRRRSVRHTRIRQGPASGARTASRAAVRFHRRSEPPVPPR